MQLDDSKYKVYIYSLDDELSSSDPESEEDSKLIFLPDIEKHLAKNRLPAHVLASPSARPDPAELLGKELVLYRVPSSISVPEEQDSVRKAILEARERARARRERVEQEIRDLGDVPMEVAEGDSGPGTPGEDSDAMELD
jgi:hypothetical protein